jgi:hypothetical protein
MKLGADRKKVIMLGALAAVAAYFLYSNVFSSPSGSSAARPHPARPSTADAGQAGSSTPQTSAGNRKSTGRSAHEFRPSLKKTPDIDTNTIDPKLRLDLLAKVQAVELSPAERNIFQFGAAPAPAMPIKDPGKIIPKNPIDIARENAAKAAALGPPQPPPPPPITLKYYGYTAQRGDGRKRAFFLDGDDIFVAAEGELVKRRYKIVRIGLSSAVVEDTQFNNTQTLPLTPEEAAG